MADTLKSKKPQPDPRSTPPATHNQTKPVETTKISPQHNTTEPYGTSDSDASRNSGA